MSELVDLARELTQRSHAALAPEELDRLLAAALESLARVVPYDLASVLVLDDHKLRVRLARGPLAGEVGEHVLDLEHFPSIQRSLETRRPVAFLDHHHQGPEGDPYDGVLDLPPGHSCMVVPLFAQDRTLGAMTLDRSVCEPYPQALVDLAGVYGEVLGVALLLGDQARRLAEALEALKEENRLLQVAAQGATTATARLEACRAPAMARLVDQARQVAAAEAPVLLTGETGVGKEVLARALHDWSPRREGPFVSVNGAALPENLVESELFGHVKGAFTGAGGARPGRFQTANGGTLLLDEVGELPLPAQAKLLRVLQEGTFEPVGSDRTLRVDVRVIAATHVDLPEAVAAGRFREDLYYRLAVVPLRVPPLRERPEDVGPLAEAILAELHARRGRGPWRLADSARDWLARRAWPGNVRELRNALERATILRGPGLLEAADFQGQGEMPAAPARPPVDAEGPAWPSLAEHERTYLARVLADTRGKIYGPGGAAERVGLKPSTLQARLKKHGLERGDFLGG